MRDGNREYFYKNLDRHSQGLRQTYQKKYGFSYELKSDNNEKLLKIFHDKCGKYGIAHNNDEIFRYLHTYEETVQSEQMTLF